MTKVEIGVCVVRYVGGEPRYCEKQAVVLGIVKSATTNDQIIEAVFRLRDLSDQTKLAAASRAIGYSDILVVISSVSIGYQNNSASLTRSVPVGWINAAANDVNVVDKHVAAIVQIYSIARVRGCDR